MLIKIDGIEYVQQYKHEERMGCMEARREDTYQACEECKYNDRGRCPFSDGDEDE
jgi:hypothetical protein